MPLAASKLKLPKLIFILYFEAEADRARIFAPGLPVRGLILFFIKTHNEIMMTVNN